MNLDSPELFINMKRIPDKLSEEYKPFFKNELDKIKNGVTINGVHIGGWLYWHINHWSIFIDEEDRNGKVINRIKRKPWLRDNEWIIDDGIRDADVPRNRHGLLIIGSRQFGKSEFGSSYMGRQCVAFKNSQNIVAGLSQDDLQLLLSKFDRGMNELNPYFRLLRIKNELNKVVIFGKRTVSDERSVYSELLIRNLWKGKNSDALAGPTTSSLLLDEVGKGLFLAALIAARPSFDTPFGWRAMPIFTGTSGSFDKGKDLEDLVQNLETYKFKMITMQDEKHGTIHYIPGYQASRADRKIIRLSTYLDVQRGSELDNIPIHVVKDIKYETEKIKKSIEDLKNANKPILSKQEQMYYPVDPEDLFLTNDSENTFGDIKDIAKEHLNYLNSIEVFEEYGFMSRDTESGSPKFTKSTKRPISSFPTEEGEDKNAPIIIWSHPLPGQQFGVLHVAGSDPYNQDESVTSPSLGTLYIFRRTYDPINGKHQQMFVASYSARPKNIGKWREQVRLLLEYYGAVCLPENEEPGFIRYFDDKHLSHYLEDGLDLAKEINPKTQVKRKKGLSASPNNIKFGNGLFKDYCQEELNIGQDSQGNPIIKPGIIRIKDKMLLQEIISFDPNDSLKKNVDRIVGARHALICASIKDKLFPVAHVDTESTKEKVKPVVSPFNVIKTKAFRSIKSPFRNV